MSVERKETAPDADAVGQPGPSTGVQDHVLLVVKAMVNGTSVSALIDSGASRSFVSDRLQCRPGLAVCGSIFCLGIGEWGDNSLHRNCPTGVGMHREHTLSTIIDRSPNDGRDTADPGQGLAGHHESLSGLAIKHDVVEEWASSWSP